MRKDSISKDALEKAMLIYAERGHKIEDYSFSHAPTDYKRNTVEEPEHTSKLRDAFNELLPANVANGERYEDLKKKSEELDLRIDEQQNKLRICRMRGNFKEFHRCMQEMQDMIKEKERLDAKMAVATPGGNDGQKKIDDYNRTYDQDDSYSEAVTLGDRILDLEERIRTLMEFAEREEA
jgi:hypothetical protein